jgi:tetratricopeptide (TPR) repeat protein
MEIDPPIGRETHLRVLLGAVPGPQDGLGAVIFVEGLAGMGKSTLVNAFRRVVDAAPEYDHVEVAIAKCDAAVGREDAYEPFKELVRSLASPSRKGNLGDLILSLLREVGPDLLGLIPGLGTTASAAVKAGVKARDTTARWAMGADARTQQDLTESVRLQYLQTLQGLARQTPLALIIEDAHWIDSASAQLCARLAESFATTPLLLILTYRSNFLRDSNLYGIHQELVIHGAKTIEVAGLERQDIQRYIEQRYGNDPTKGKMAAWLLQLSGGCPMFIVNYLTLLQDQSVVEPAAHGFVLQGRLVKDNEDWALDTPAGSLRVPPSIEEVLRQRIERIESGRKLLELGSVQGLEFMSLVLAKLALVAPNEVLRELRQIELRDRVIMTRKPEAWARRDLEVYGFEHALIQQALYERLGRLEREQYHLTVATVLRDLLGKVVETGQPTPRRLLLEIAHHLRKAGELALAARSAVAAAESCYAEGAFREAGTLCRQALKDLGQVETLQVEDDRARARGVHMLLATSEPQLGGWPGEDIGALADLISDGQAAAQRSGDVHLLAQLQVLKGKYLVARGRLEHAVQELSLAVTELRKLGDVFGELCAMVELGHRQMGVRAEQGMTTLLEAHRLLEREETTMAEQIPPAALDRLRGRLQGSIGVAEFDYGRFDTAISFLEQSVEMLKRGRMYDFSSMHSNFLSQALIATGRFEEAEPVLLEAIQLLGGDEAQPSAQTAYNLGLLGKLYLEWGRIDDAVGPLRDGWHQMRKMPINNLLPLVAAYYAELLMMHPGLGANSGAEAERTLADALQHSLQSGFSRSVVMTRSLLARLHLEDSKPRLALGFSQGAAEQLWRAQVLPAVREEEVYYLHFQVLNANGQSENSTRWLRRAWDVLGRKAQSISDERRRNVFLKRVHTSRAIVQAATAAAIID